MIAGHDRNFASALVFPNLGRCRDAGGPRSRGDARRRGGPPRGAPALPGSVRHAGRRRAPAVPRSWPRAVILDVPPSLDAKEITDKGSLNQKAVLQHRAATVEDLYADSPSDRVLQAAARPPRKPYDRHPDDPDADDRSLRAHRHRRARAPRAHRRDHRRRREGQGLLQGRRRPAARGAGRVLPVAQDGVRHLHRGRDAERQAEPVERRRPRVRREAPRPRDPVHQHQPESRRRRRGRSQAAPRHRARCAG